MTYLPFAILSQLLNSIAVTVDKFLLTKTIPDPIIYIFYFSAISLFFIFAIPFVDTPSIQVIVLASTSTLFWTAGAYLMFKALKTGQVQRVIPIIGTITPLILLILAAQTHSINTGQTVAVTVLILGLVFLTISDLKGKLFKSELILEISSASAFAFNYYLLSLAFLRQDFLTVLVWSRPILIPLGLAFLIIPSLRKKITSFIQLTLLSPRKSFDPEVLRTEGRGPINNRIPALLFIFGQASATVSEVLLFLSISLANPAIVNSLQGIKYIFLIIFSLILGKKFPAIFKNPSSSYFWLAQILGIGFIGVGLYLLAVV